MESEHIKAGHNKTVGKDKEEIDEATDDKPLEAKGRFQRAKAKVQDAIGDLKDAVE